MAFMFGVLPMLFLFPVLAPLALIEGSFGKIWEFISKLFTL